MSENSKMTRLACIPVSLGFQLTKQGYIGFTPRSHLRVGHDPIFDRLARSGVISRPMFGPSMVTQEIEETVPAFFQPRVLYIFVELLSIFMPLYPAEPRGLPEELLNQHKSALAFCLHLCLVQRIYDP